MNTSTPLQTTLFTLAAVFVATVSLIAAPEAMTLLPKNNEIQGWNRKGDARLFEHSKLWEYIDGGADVYLDYGFQKVATVELVNEKRSVIVDIYDMKTLEGAFGIYARERAPSYHFIPVGTEGYQEGVALNFYQGSFYVKLTAFTDDQATRAVLLKLAQIISRKIGSDRKIPAPLSLLPWKGRIKHSENFDMKKHLDQVPLRECYSAQYTLGGRKFTALLCVAVSPSVAKSRLQSMRPALQQAGSLDASFAGTGDALLTGKHRDAGEIVLVVKGKYLVGLYPVPDVKSAGIFLKSFLASLK